SRPPLASGARALPASTSDGRGSGDAISGDSDRSGTDTAMTHQAYFRLLGADSHHRGQASLSSALHSMTNSQLHWLRSRSFRFKPRLQFYWGAPFMLAVYARYARGLRSRSARAADPTLLGWVACDLSSMPPSR